MWILNEETTGLRVVDGRTQKETIENFYHFVRDHHITKKKVRELIRDGIQNYGHTPKSPKKGYFYITVHGGTTFHAVPQHKLVKGKSVVIPGWEKFRFFLHKE